VPRILQSYEPSVFHFTENFLRIVLPFAEGYASDGVAGVARKADSADVRLIFTAFFRVRN
jgi:hypothetical protein